LPITEAELRLIAGGAIIGDNSQPARPFICLGASVRNVFNLD
jgi:hypothetical protein